MEGRDANYRLRSPCTTPDGRDARYRFRRVGREDLAARWRGIAEVLLRTFPPRAGGDRSDRLDAVVSGADGRGGAPMAMRCAGRDPSGQAPQAKKRPKRCPASAEAAGRESLSNDLDALDRAARSARVATPPSSMGGPAIPIHAHPAIDGTQPRSQAGTRAMEPSGPACTVDVASGSSCQRATESTDEVVSVLARIHR